MAAQLEEAEAGKQALQEQLYEAQLQAQSHRLLAHASGAAAAAAAALAGHGAPRASTPAVHAGSDYRLDARATSTLIWGAPDGAAALPFGSPAASPESALRVVNVDAGTDTTQGSAARDQGVGAGEGAVTGSVVAKPVTGMEAAPDAPSSPVAAAIAAAADVPGKISSPVGSDDGSFITAASAGPVVSSEGGVAAPLQTPSSISGPLFPGFSTPLSRLPAPGSGGASSSATSTLSMLGTLRGSVTPRRLLSTPGAGPAAGGAGAPRPPSRPSSQCAMTPVAKAGLAGLLTSHPLVPLTPDANSSEANECTARGSARSAQQQRRMQQHDNAAVLMLEGFPLLSPVRAGELGADGSGRLFPSTPGPLRLRHVQALWGQDEGREGSATASAAAATIRTALMQERLAASQEAAAVTSSQQGFKEAATVDSAVQQEQGQRAQEEPCKLQGLAPPLQQQRQQRGVPKRCRGRPLVKLLVVASLASAGVAAARVQPDVVEAARTQAAGALRASEQACRGGWKQVQQWSHPRWQQLQRWSHARWQCVQRVWCKKETHPGQVLVGDDAIGVVILVQARVIDVPEEAPAGETTAVVQEAAAAEAAAK